MRACSMQKVHRQESKKSIFQQLSPLSQHCDTNMHGQSMMHVAQCGMGEGFGGEGLWENSKLICVYGSGADPGQIYQ